jgi:hypothetical protein
LLRFANGQKISASSKSGEIDKVFPYRRVGIQAGAELAMTWLPGKST